MLIDIQIVIIGIANETIISILLILLNGIYIYVLCKNMTPTTTNSITKKEESKICSRLCITYASCVCIRK